MIPKLEFGRTGHMSTRILFGAAALGGVTQAEADQTLDVLLKYGINHIDTAASYGHAEERIGPWMKEHRKDFFLATKTEERTYEGAMEQLQRSLERMRVDSVDLWQMHVLSDEESWQTAYKPDGALKAFLEAREQGLVRYLGVTGHGLEVANFHLRSLEQHNFDSVLLPYNPSMMENPTYAASLEALAAKCKADNVAFQTIKSLCHRPWGENEEHIRATWYKPFEDQADIDTAVHWILSRPGIFLNSTGDIHILPRLLDAASRFDENMQQSDLAPTLADMEMEPLFA